GLGQDRRVGQGQRREPAVLRAGTIVACKAAEELGLTFTPVTLLARAVLAGSVDRRQQPRPQRSRWKRPERSIVSRQRIERSCLHQALKHSFVHETKVDVFTESMQRGDAPLFGPHVEQRLNRAVPHVPDRGQSKSDATGGYGEPELALVDVRRKDWNAALATFAEVQRQLVGVLRFNRQQGRGKVPWVVRLEISRLVGQDRV